MNLTRRCIDNPVLAWVLMAAIAIAGGLAGSRLGVSQLPDNDRPTIRVDISWPGAAPEVVEREVAEVIEEALAQVDGMSALQVSCSRGSANFTIQLALDRPVDAALQDVQSKVAQAQRRLPRDIDPPIIQKSNPEDEPVFWLALVGPMPAQELFEAARSRIADRLQSIPGVGEVILGGNLNRVARVWIDPAALAAHDLSLGELAEALRRQNLEAPAGVLQSGGREIALRVPGEAGGIQALGELPVASRGGMLLRLREVAVLEDGFQDSRRIARVDGVEGQAIGVKKQHGSNAVAVAEAVRQEIERIRSGLPAGMSLVVNYDASRFVTDSFHEMLRELLGAVVLTAVVCLVFLGSLAAAFNVLLAIPMALLGTLMVLHLSGFTLNTFTLLALALAVGLVVDDAIMVQENIFRHRALGLDARRAALIGTREIRLAALAASASVIAIFAPVAFLDGEVGRSFLQFAVALCAAVALSYAEAVTLAPARCAQFLRAHHGASRLERLADGLLGRLSALYARGLAPLLRRPLLALMACGLLALPGLGLLVRLPVETIPPQDQDRLVARLGMPPGATIEETERVFRRAEAEMAAMPEVVSVFASFGSGNGMLYGRLLPRAERRQSQQDLVAVLRKRLAAIPGPNVGVWGQSVDLLQLPAGGKVDLILRGSRAELLPAAEAVLARLRADPRLVEADHNAKPGPAELRVLPDRERAADLGISAGELADAVGIAAGGLNVGKLQLGGRRGDVRVQLPARFRRSSEDLGRLRLRLDDGGSIPLMSIARFEEGPGQGSLNRRDRSPSITISAGPAPGVSQGEAVAAMAEAARGLAVEARPGDGSKGLGDAIRSLLFALGFGVLAAYLVLAAQFASWLHPLTVLSILPLAAAGAGAALWVAGASLNVFSGVGILLLMGIVTKNSILIVDRANQLLREGKTAAEAAAEAGRNRLRPILMTAAATIVAALPIALALGPGGEMRAPMGLAVVGGVAFSTLLSLAAVPTLWLLWSGRPRPQEPGR